MQTVLHLTDADVEALVDLPAAEEAVARAFAAWGRGEAATTTRARAVAPSAMASAMAAVVPPYSGGKLYATVAGRFTFVLVLFAADGRVLATLDGDAVTRLRTPAATSLAIRHLAPAHVRTATLIGAGTQGWTHLQALAGCLPGLEELRVCGRPGSARAAALTRRARDRGWPAVTCDDPTAAVDGADVVVTVTDARGPLFPAAAVADGVLVCAVGATKADRAEIDPALVGRCAAVVCDDVRGAMVECGDLLRAADEGCFEWSRAVELHDVVAGTVDVPRAGPAPVLFETQGVALQDVAVAALAYERHHQAAGRAVTDPEEVP